MTTPATTGNTKIINGTADQLHKAVDDFAVKAAVGAERLRGNADRVVDTVTGTAHRVVESAADGATSASKWLAKQQIALIRQREAAVKACNDTIRARPLTVVGTAFAAGIAVALMVGLRRR
jgi:ElaB/YqjD/DUF883 family membrane-anchored ribosome-binding protein